MKKLLLMALMFISTLAFSQTTAYTEDGNLFTGTYIEHYDNGNLKISAEFVDGRKDGNVLTFYEDGSKKELFSYKDGKFHGIVKSWDMSGLLTGIAFYNMGAKDGKWEIYMDGTLQYEIYYSDGKRINAVRPQESL